MQVQNASDLNHVASTGKIDDLIKIDETLQSYRLINIGKEIYEKKDKIKGRLIATEVIEVPRIEQSMSQEYLEYKKRMRY